MQGDSLFAIAKQYNIKPETILYSNEATLNDNPSNLSPGMELLIPPADGLTYTWKDGDTLDSVADQFRGDLNEDKKIDEVDAALLRDAIVSWPSNDLDLTDPEVKAGQVVMIPGGRRELVSWLEFVPTINRDGSTATSELGGSACAAGPGSPPGIWPTDGPHTLSGNNYSGSHLGIDITASTSTAVLASGGGVVVFAGFSQYGYGNVVQIDHMDGFATVYGHLSQINVSQCQVVYGGQVIGVAGSTGNSTGVHLHFEVRQGNVNMNPWSIVQ
jgi:murein DD-endopeptidase MepM/ murein hydrolase activator NlpD